MIKYENECVGCLPEMGCLGTACPNRDVPHYYCDSCKGEYAPEDLYEYDGKMWCKECLVEYLLEDIPNVA